MCAVLLTGSMSLCARPERIVSLNLCTDLLVLSLADREQIASLSYLSADPQYSPLADQTTGLYLNHGLAEEVIDLDSDLILSSQFSATAAVNLLQSLDYEVTVLGFPETVAQSIEQIRQVAALLGAQDRGEALIRDMQSDIARARQELGQAEYRTLFLASNGMTYGSNTLRHTFLDSLGWHNLAAALGLNGVAPINLEHILAGQPDFILVNSRHTEDEHLAHHLLKHPALASLAGQQALLELPDALFQCAGPSLAQAYLTLADELARHQELSSNE